MFAQGAHQPLGQHTIDCGGDQVTLHPHILHADDRPGCGVGVQGRQHQVPRERGLHRNLRRLTIAHFTDHDDVRVLPQDGTQCVGKGQVDLGMHLNLVDTFELVFHRIFDGDDFLTGRIQLGQRRIQGGGLAGTGRSGHKQDAVGLGQQGVEALQRIRLKTHLVEIQAHTGAVQNPHHHAFAMHSGHGGDTQVELPPLHTHLDAAVLRQAALGNIQVRQQLDPRIDRGTQARRHDLGVVNDTVHAVAHMQAIVKRLQVDVRGTHVNHAADDGVDQTDHRCFAGQILEVFDKIARVTASIEIVGPLIDLLAHRLGQGLFNVGLQRQVGPDGEPGGQAQGLEYEGVLWACHRHSQLAIGHGQRIHRIGVQELGQQARHFRRLGRKCVCRNERNIELARQRVRNIKLRHNTQLNQHLPEQITQLLLRRKRPLQISGRQLAGLDQHLAQPLALRRRL